MRGLWPGLAEVAEDHWRWFVVVLPVTVFTVWSVAASASRLHVPAMVSGHVAVLGSLSPAWQLGLLFGVITLLCAMVVYSDVDSGALLVLAYAGLGVVLLVVVSMAFAADQRGRDVTLFLAVWGQFLSTVLTFLCGLSLRWGD